MKFRFTVILLLGCMGLKAQILPAARSVDWSVAGLRPSGAAISVVIDGDAAGLVGDGVTPNDAAMQSILAPLGSTPTIIMLSSGVYLFNSRISLPNRVVLRGLGAASTSLKFNLGGNNDCIQIAGSQTISDSTYLTANAAKGQNFAEVTNPSRYPAGAFIRLMQNDSALMYSTWAYKTLGQIVQVDSAVGNRVYFSNALRRDYDLAQRPYFVRINPKENVGIECLKIDRVDSTAGQTSNIFMNYAANCWVRGIESANCNNAHINISTSTNIDVRNNYLHHSYGYGGGGRGYGLLLQATTGEVLAENNIFRHLRHSVLLQSGANGNVVGYNYSADPYWNESFFPTNSAGDLVLHGNMPYANLFEGNVVQNIVIDVSHGANGEHNTFFRNRAELYGIFFSANSSPNQNFIANDVTNTSNGLYSLQGSGHFEYANRFRGNTMPAGTDATPLLDTSYYRSSRPDFLPTAYYASIGLPNANNTGANAAADRDVASQPMANACGAASTPVIGFVDNQAIQVNEDAGSIQIPIRIFNVNAMPTSIEISYIANSTTATEGADFTGLSSPIVYTWQSYDNQMAYLNLQIADDTEIENMETLRLVLRNPDNGAILAADSTLFVQILDNDGLAIAAPATQITRIYPNPCADWLAIEGGTHWEQVQIYDALGRLLLADPAQNRLDLRQLPDGLLFVKLQNQQSQQTHAIIKYTQD